MNWEAIGAIGEIIGAAAKKIHERRKHWSPIITYRLEEIRIISVRRSRELEVALYESQVIG